MAARKRHHIHQKRIEMKQQVKTIKIENGKVYVSGMERPVITDDDPQGVEYANKMEALNASFVDISHDFESSLNAIKLIGQIGLSTLPVSKDGIYSEPEGMFMDFQKINDVGGQIDLGDFQPLAIVSFSPVDPVKANDEGKEPKKHYCQAYLDGEPICEKQCQHCLEHLENTDNDTAAVPVVESEPDLPDFESKAKDRYPSVDMTDIVDGTDYSTLYREGYLLGSMDVWNEHVLPLQEENNKLKLIISGKTFYDETQKLQQEIERLKLIIKLYKEICDEATIPNSKMVLVADKLIHIKELEEK